MSEQFSNIVKLGDLYSNTNMKTNIFDIGYILTGCQGELVYKNDNIQFLNTSDEEYINSMLQKLKIEQNKREVQDGTYSIYIDPSNKTISLLSGLDYQFKIDNEIYIIYNNR